MRQSAVDDCSAILFRFGISVSTAAAIDVGGTETVFLDGASRPNPLLAQHPGLMLFDRGFTQEALGTAAHEEADFLDKSTIAKFERRFDLVYSFDTIEHVSNPFLFAEHLISITRPGGHIYLATVFQWMYHPSPEDYFRFSPAGLRELFENPANGLRDECTVLWCGWGTDPKGTALLARRKGTGATDVTARHEAVCASVPELLA